MPYFTDGSIPRDTTGFPVGSVYVPNIGTVGVQGGSVLTDNDAVPYAPMIVQPVASASVNGTLQNAAGANGNGTTLALLGNSSVILTVTQTGFTGTVNFEVSEDNTNWDPLQVTQEGTNTIVTSLTGSTTTSTHLYEGSVAGLQSIRARVSGFSAGTVTVTAHAVPGTDAPRVLNVDLYGKNTTPGDTAVLVDSSGNMLMKYASPYPNAATPLTADSGNVAAATATATLAATTGKTTYITGYQVTASGATSAAVVTGTITGVITGTLHFTFTAPAGATTACTPLIVSFPYPIPASATNTTIAVALPSLGTGNTNATVAAYGFQL